MATSLCFDNSSSANLVNERLLVLEEMLDLVERAQTHVHASGAAVVVRQGDALIVRTGTGTVPEVGVALMCGQGAVGKCSRQPYCGTPAPNEIDGPLAAVGVRSLVAVPVHSDGEFLGVLLVTSSSAEAFSRMHVAILMTMVSDASRVMRRLQAIGQAAAAPAPNITEIPVPAVQATPLTKPESFALPKITEMPAPSVQASPVTKPQPVVEPSKEVEVRKPAPIKLDIDPPRMTRIAPPASQATPNSANKVTPLSALKFDAEPTPPQGPVPELLCPGDDPLKFGSVAKVKKAANTDTFTTGTVYHGPVKRGRLPAQIMSLAAVLVVATGAFASWRHFRATPSEESAPAPRFSFATPPSAPASAPETAPVAPAVVTIAAKPSPTRPEPKAEVAKAVVPSAQPAPETKPAQPVMEIAEAAPKPAAPQPEAVAAPSLSGLNLNSHAAMPDLPAPKVDKPALTPHQSVVTQAVALHTPAPVYPELARRNGISGEVHLRLNLSNQGKVVSVDSAQGPVMLLQAAEIAVRQWQFRPATVDGKPVNSTVAVAVKFAK